MFRFHQRFEFVFKFVLPLTELDSPQQAPGPLGTLPKDLRVLVIDDDETVCSGMVRLLESWGCQCQAASSVSDAIAAARVCAPSIIISDYRLREQQTGAQVISALRAAAGMNLPALIITGDTAPERPREASASGDPLLHKPVRPEQLYQTLMRLVV